MARTSVLPLPDDAVRHILAHIDDLRSMFPTSRGNRPFLAAFVRLVHQATGNVYGAGTIRKLLQTYAPEYRPATATIQDELAAFRESHNTGHRDSSPHHGTVTETFTPDSGLSTAAGTADLAHIVAGLERVLANVPTTQPGTSIHQDALAQSLEAENQRLRSYADHLVHSLKQAQQEREQALLDLEAARTESATHKATVEGFIQQVADLAEAVKNADERSAATQRFAIARIEAERAELHRYKDLYKQAQADVEAAKKLIADEKNMSEALRRALNAKRSEQP